MYLINFRFVAQEAALEYVIVDLKPPNVHTKYKRGWRDGLDRHIMHAHADVAYLTNLDLMEQKHVNGVKEY